MLSRTTLRLLLAVSVAVAAGVAREATAISDQIAYQGRLTLPEGAPVADGDYAMSFTLYDAQSGGSLLWSETQGAVTVADGLFTAMLGSETPFSEGLFSGDGGLWLEVAADLDGDGFGPDDVYAPRTPLAAVPSAFHARRAATSGTVSGEAYIMVETTDDPAANGLHLLAAYDEARSLTPHGEAPGPDNRVVVLVAPGRYDLGETPLMLDTEYVDLVGLSTARDNQYIVGESGGADTGVLMQSASSVRIENLVVECTRSSGGAPTNSSTPAAYFPESDLPDTIVRNATFIADESNAWSMRVSVEYSGTYIDVLAGQYAFGGGGNGVASGHFERCTADNHAFGGNGGVASGTFIDCTGDFHAFGGNGVASGYFRDCTGGINAFGGFASGVSSGVFFDCVGGANAFGGNGGVASGTYYRCEGGNRSFGGSGGDSSEAQLFDCRMVGGIWAGDFNGKMDGGEWQRDMNLGDDARIYNVTVLGNVDLGGSSAGIAYSRIQGGMLNSVNASFEFFNLTDAEIR